ncbi:putative agamous-like MADS-box protein AGL31-like [Capsicum annuum]|nr:putative agamous-like MADS-box protein AGL31-like [Capsicum annuum]
MMRRQQDQQSKLLYELSTLILNVLQAPTMQFEFSGQSPVIQRSTQSPPARPMQPITPAGFASLLLGISMSLMLCGSVTFFIGFFMMPWILALVMVLYLAGIVSTLSMIGRAIFCPMPSSQSPRKDVQRKDCSPLLFFDSRSSPSF